MTDLTDDEICGLLDAATEGPWSAERDLPYNKMPRVHSDADRSLICECGNVGTTQDQWEANARLIAAAPDLAAEVLRLRTRVKELEAPLRDAYEVFNHMGDATGEMMAKVISGVLRPAPPEDTP